MSTQVLVPKIGFEKPVQESEGPASSKLSIITKTGETYTVGTVLAEILLSGGDTMSCWVRP